MGISICVFSPKKPSPFFSRLAPQTKPSLESMKIDEKNVINALYYSPVILRREFQFAYFPPKKSKPLVFNLAPQTKASLESMKIDEKDIMNTQYYSPVILRRD